MRGRVGKVKRKGSSGCKKRGESAQDGKAMEKGGRICDVIVDLGSRYPNPDERIVSGVIQSESGVGGRKEPFGGGPDIRPRGGGGGSALRDSFHFSSLP